MRLKSRVYRSSEIRMDPPHSADSPPPLLTSSSRSRSPHRRTCGQIRSQFLLEAVDAHPHAHRRLPGLSLALVTEHPQVLVAQEYHGVFAKTHIEGLPRA